MLLKTIKSKTNKPKNNIEESLIIPLSKNASQRIDKEIIVFKKYRSAIPLHNAKTSISGSGIVL